MVITTKDKIKAGEIFQSVISNACEYEITGDKLSVYKTLREMNPSHYMYHLKLNELEIIGSSPEMLVRVEGKNVETYPIAGTRKRGKTEEEDKKLEIKLLKDEKELAEHLMLVDLARNDAGKVSEFDSVQVPEYMTVKKILSCTAHCFTCNWKIKRRFNCSGCIWLYISCRDFKRCS